MVIPAVALKILGGAILIGSLTSSIAVPTVMTLNSSPMQADSELSPKLQKYRDKCHVLIKDEKGGEKNRKYLFVCKKDEGQGLVAEFYFYTEGNEPIKVREWKKKVDKGNGDVEVTIVLEEEAPNEVQIISPTSTWTELADKKISDCSLKNQEGEGQDWSLQCPKGDLSGSKDIPLSAITF